MNTCLQLLIHCPPFIDRLIEISPINKLSGEFYNLCKNPIKRIQTLRDQLLNTPKQNQNPSERFNTIRCNRQKKNKR